MPNNAVMMRQLEDMGPVEPFTRPELLHVAGIFADQPDRIELLHAIFKGAAMDLGETA